MSDPTNRSEPSHSLLGSSAGPNFSLDLYPLLHQLDKQYHLRKLEKSKEPWLGVGIRHLDMEQLEQLAAELRRSLIEIVAYTGGHLASNLGVVELTLALHYVFDSPHDCLLWDVGHQTYVHKMLTGRWQDFGQLRQRGGLSGFPRRNESLHDHLNAGHAGTAISAGLGLELGHRLDKQKGLKTGKVLCVVGDASLTSGMAFEAMNHCGHQPNQLVVVMNDNAMSISPNVGAVSRILSRLTAGHFYVFIRDHINQFIRSIPLLGAPAYRSLLRLKGTIKKAFYRNNLFTEFGFKYIGPIDGHNIKMLIDTFQRIAQLEEPVFLHVSTQKGKGLKEAEEAPAKYHGVSPSTKPQTQGQAPPKASSAPTTFTESFSAALMELEGNCDELVCISAAMTSSTGLQHFAERHPSRFFDVGIAEQHALTLACGLALSGKLPLLAIYSTFMQRALDQLIHDISLMNLPAIFICDRAGIVPGDGDTHQGIYDIAHFRSIIGLKLYSPGTQQQLHACLANALQQGQAEIQAWQQRRLIGEHDFRGHPILIRLPKRNCPDIAVKASRTSSDTAQTGSAIPLRKLQFFGSAAEQLFDCQALLLCSGSLLPEALAVQQQFQISGEIGLDVLQLCQIAPLPQAELLRYIDPSHTALFCIEDGVIQGGFGEELLRQLMLWQTQGLLAKPSQIAGSTATFLPVFLRGVEAAVPQLGNYQQLLQDYGLDPASLQCWITENLRPTNHGG